MKSRAMNLLVLSVSLLLLIGCGESSVSDPSQSDSDAEGGGEIDLVVEPPQQYYDALMRDQLAALADVAPSSIATLFVEFNGATVKRGYDLGQSFVVCKGDAEIPSSGFSASEQSQILAMVQEFYSKAGSNLKVTGTKPTKGAFTTMIVGGSMGDLGCVDRQGILGVAPFDKGNANKNDVGFAFTRYFDDLKGTAETITHEAGHSFGLDHVTENESIMFASSSSVIEGFIKATTKGGSVQDEPALLQQFVGKLTGGSAPTEITPSTPAPSQPGQSIPTSPTELLSGLGNLLGGVDPQLGNGLDFGNITQGVAPIFSGIIPSVQNPNFGGIGGLTGIQDLFAVFGVANQVPGIGLPQGGFNLQGIVGLISGFAGGAGVGGFADLIGMIGGGQIPSAGGIGGLITGLFGGALPIPAAGNLPLPGNLDLSQLPDFAGLLGAQNAGGVGGLLSSLQSQGNFVNQNFTGKQKDSLLTLIKMSHAQAYQKMRNK